MINKLILILCFEVNVIVEITMGKESRGKSAVNNCAIIQIIFKELLLFVEKTCIFAVRIVKTQ